MKKIKINNNLLIEVLGQIMIKPSVVKHLPNGDVYVHASWSDMDIVHKEIFSRRKVLRLIRKFFRTHKEVDLGNFKYWVRKDTVCVYGNYTYHKVGLGPYKHIA